MVNEPRRDGPDSRLCPSCGTRLSKPTNFCPECGAKQLAAVSQAAAGNDAGADRSGTPYHALVSVAAFAIVFAALGISHHGQQERTPQVPPAQRAAIGEVQVFAVAPASASNSTTPSVLASMRPNSPLPGQLEQLAAAQHTHAQEDLVGTRQDASQFGVDVVAIAVDDRKPIADGITRGHRACFPNEPVLRNDGRKLMPDE